MSEFYAYHVVTNQAMHLGQKLSINNQFESGVFKRVTERKTEVENLYAQESNDENSSFEHHLSVAFRELALEEIRQQSYQDYPSRLHCLYISKTLEESQKWFEFFQRIGRPTLQIVKLKINGNCFVGDATKCFEGTNSKNKNLQLARNYWQHQGVAEVEEMLVNGEIEVIEIIKES